MRTLFYTIIALFIGTSTYAQTPQKISYQVVIRDAEGILITNKEQRVNLSILQGNESGIEVYTETHFTETNANGLVSLEIGSGKADGSVFSSIDWGNGPYFIKTETTIDGETITSIAELLSVPYALHAKDASKVNGFTVGTSVPVDAVFTDNQKATEIPLSSHINIGGAEVKTVEEAISRLHEEIIKLQKGK